MECEENNTLPNEEFPIHQLTKKEEASLDMMGNLFEKLAANVILRDYMATSKLPDSDHENDGDVEDAINNDDDEDFENNNDEDSETQSDGEDIFDEDEDLGSHGKFCATDVDCNGLTLDHSLSTRKVNQSLYKMKTEIPDVIIISSDDESSTSSDQSEIHEFKKKLNRIVSNGTEPYELGFAKEPYDGKSQANFVEVFDSPIKLEIKNADKETLKVSIPPPSNQGKIQSCPSPFPKRPATENHSDVSAKRFCAVSPKLDLSDSPIARAFYAQRSKTFEEDYSVRIGVSAPLKVSLNMPRSSSLQPKFFSNNQLDFLESLADDSIVDKAYLDTVLSFSSSTVAPPQQVIQHILSNIAVSKNERISRKAITILNHLFSIRILSNRNFPLTWDFMCDLFDRLVSEAKIFTDSLRSGNLSNKPLYANCSQMFLHILNLLEQDFKRFAKNIRNTIVWKLVSPNVYGSARLRTVSQWFTAMFSIIEEMDGVSVENRTRLFSSLYVTKALQRLVSLIFLSNRNPEDFSQPIAEMYLNCFFEIRLIKLRKELLQSIENAMVQRKAVELILSTICEDSERSAENEIKRLSLESIVFCFFYKVPPRKCEQTESYCSQEEIEEFVFLLYLLVRSYLALNCGAHDSMSKLSILNPHEMDHAGHQLPLPDRETLLTINEQLSLLEDRLIGYVGHTKLESPTKMYLALLSRLLNDACESNGASAIRQGT